MWELQICGENDGPIAGKPAPTGTAHGLSPVDPLWEILWFSASRFDAFGGVFVLIFHQSECHPCQLPG
ncbi:hypothetical protein, partial [Pseudomonas inefficax]|uniref:hypothetical protein n=1 Tax=Pseudomonas inefficax TaxID=2078786 RepID=UPI002DBCADE3